MKTTHPLVFQDVTFDVVDRDQHPWLRVSQIAQAFGHTNTSPITQLYDRHKDEFTSTMTALVDLPTPGGVQTVRIFSLRGAHLLGMFARTERAKEFRRWVLNVLETHGRRDPVPIALPAPAISREVELSIKQRARVLADSWYAAYCLQMRHQIRGGGFAPEHVASWMPATGGHFPAPTGGPFTRMITAIDETGLAVTRPLKDSERIFDGKDLKALADAIYGFTGKYDLASVMQSLKPG